MKLRTIVERHAKAFGGNAGVAHAIGMTNSGLLRGLKANRLSVESLIRLAYVTKENAETVLRLGGQADIADLIRAQFGSAAQPVGWNPSVIEERWADLERSLARIKVELLSQMTVTPAAGAVVDGEDKAPPPPAAKKKARKRVKPVMPWHATKASTQPLGGSR